MKFIAVTHHARERMETFGLSMGELINLREIAIETNPMGKMKRQHDVDQRITCYDAGHYIFVIKDVNKKTELLITVYDKFLNLSADYVVKHYDDIKA
jgi:hypothetical protein